MGKKPGVNITHSMVKNAVAAHLKIVLSLAVTLTKNIWRPDTEILIYTNQNIPERLHSDHLLL